MGFLFALGCYFVPLAVLGGPIAWHWRRRAAWQTLDSATSVIPFGVWLWVSMFNLRPKSMSNVVGEPVLLGLLVGATVCARVVLAPVLGPRRASVLWLAIASASGLLVWFYVPLLNE